MLFAQRMRILSGIALFALAACNISNGMSSTPSAAGAGRAVSSVVSPQTLTDEIRSVADFRKQAIRRGHRNPKAPYLNGLAQSGANMTQSFAIRHPASRTMSRCLADRREPYTTMPVQERTAA